MKYIEIPLYKNPIVFVDIGFSKYFGTDLTGIG